MCNIMMWVRGVTDYWFMYKSIMLKAYDAYLNKLYYDFIRIKEDLTWSQSYQWRRLLQNQLQS